MCVCVCVCVCDVVIVGILRVDDSCLLWLELAACFLYESSEQTKALG